MNTEQLTEVALGLQGLCYAQEGQIEALTITLETLISTLASGQLPFLDSLSQGIEVMADARLEQMSGEYEVIKAPFISKIATIQSHLKIMIDLL